jgi:hypothetical protein
VEYLKGSRGMEMIDFLGKEAPDSEDNVFDKI